MRRLIVITATFFLFVAGCLLLALRSEPLVIGAARWAVAAFTDLRLELRSPSVNVFGGELSAAELHLVPASHDGPPLLSLMNLSARFPVPGKAGDALSGSALRADAVTVYTSDSGKVSRPSPMQSLGYLRWLPSTLDIAQLRLIDASAETRVFPLKSVQGRLIEQGNYRLAAEADYEGEPLGITVELLAVDKGWGVTAADVKVALLAPESASEVTLAGTLEGTAEHFEYNFAINAYYRDIHDFLRGVDADSRLRGALRLQGTLAGDSSRLMLSDATFLLDNAPDYAFQASGSLEYEFAGDSTIALEALGEITSLASMLEWTGLDLGDFGRTRSSIRLSGSLDKPVVDAFSLTSRSEAGLTLTMDGQLDLFELEVDSGPGARVIAVELKGPSLAALEPWLGKLPYDLGPWRAAGQLSGTRGDLSLHKLVLEAGTPGVIEINATGIVGRISTGRGQQKRIAAEDIDLNLHASVADSLQLNALLGRDDIPPHHELTAAFAIKGSAEELQLSAGQLAITASDLAVNIGPLSGVVHPGREFRLSELAAPVLIDISDTAALSQYSRLRLPVLGPVRIGGRLAQQGEALQLLDIKVAIGEGKPAAEVTGRIGNLATLSDANFSGKISYIDTGTLLATLVPGFSYQASLGGLGGTFKLKERKGKWTLSDLALAAGDKTTLLAFTLEGEVSDLSGLPSIDLDATLRLADPALLQAISGRALKPLSGSLDVVTSPGEIHGTLKALLGDTKISGDTRVQLGDKRVQGIKIALETPLLKLQDFGFYPARFEDKALTDTPAAIDAANRPAVLEGPTQAAPPAPESGPPLLAQLRENSPAFPLELSIRIDELSGDSSKLENLQLRISGSGQRYTLQQLTANYNQALAEVRGIIDLNPTPPALSLSAQATALPLGAILRDVGITTNVTGALTILGGVTVMGETAEAMVSSMNGSVALALEKAVLKGAAYDLLATDLLAWIYTGALKEESTRLDCAMAKFALQNGVATTENLFIESTKMVASGSAKFDLVKRRMDLRLTPVSKSRLLQVPSRIRLKGDMSNPKAEISPVAAVADATSSALMLIPELTLKLFGVNRAATGDFRPCLAELGN